MELEPGPKVRFASGVVPWLAGAGALVVYLLTLNHWLSGGNLLQVAKVSGWVWQPELYEPLLWLVTYPFRWLPLSAIPLALNLFASLCASLTLMLLARSVALLPHDRTPEQRRRELGDFGVLSMRAAWLPPVLAVMVCGLQMTFWENATAFSGEMLNVLVFAYVIRCLLEYRVDEGRPWLYRAAFAYGLGITNNWAMLGFFLLFLAALAWIKGALEWTRGKGLRFFFNPRFLGRMLLWGSAGLLLYLLLPLTRSWGDSAVPFWAGLKANLGTQRGMLLGLYYSLSTQDRLVQLLISLVPIFIISIRWGSNLDASRLGTILARLLFLLFHAFLMIICIWAALDPPFSPRSKGLGPFLPSYYLRAITVGYCIGYFLLLFSGKPKRPALIPDSLRFINRVVTIAVWLLFLAVPVALVYRNMPKLRTTNGPILRTFADFVAQGLPAHGCVVLSDDSHYLLLAQSAVAARGKSKEFIFLDTGSLTLPGYHRYLKKHYPRSWPSEPPRDSKQPFEPIMLLQLMTKLSETNSIYYLHPSFGYYFESFYPEPHGLAQKLVSYPTRVLLSPPLTDELIKENENFWAKADEQTLRPLVAVITQRLVTKAHAKWEVNLDALAVAVFFSRALNAWGAEMQRAGKLAEAAVHFERALELNPDNIVAQINLDCNKNLQNGRHSSVQLSKSIEDAFGKYGNWDQVVGANGPFDEPNFCFEQGRVFIRSALYRQAAREFTRVKTLDPDEVSSRIYLAQLYLLGQMPEKALKPIAEVHNLPESMGDANTNKDKLLFVEISAHLAKQDVQGAQDSFQAAMKMHPGDDSLLAVATEAFMNYGQKFSSELPSIATQCYSNALAATEEQLTLAPTNTTALVNQGLAFFRLGAYDQAIPPLTRVLTLETNTPNYYAALINRAVSYLRSEQFDAAQADSETLQKAYPNAFQVYYHLGEMAYRRKDTNAALRNYELYLTNAPPNTEESKFVAGRIKELKPSTP
jgi:tetratricopeptide (TPR) repeat protein